MKKRKPHEGGFTLIEIICVLAIVGMLAALALPALPHSTSRVDLEAFAVETASLLKSDRNAAIREHKLVSTEMNADARLIRSGYDRRTIELPSDVALDALVARQCGGRMTGTTIDFFPSGMSCGGTIALSRLDTVFQIRVNWLTGGIEIVSTGRS